MKTLFSTPADNLPDELQVLRETLWTSWESDTLPQETWLKQIGARAHPKPQEAFDAFVGAGVLVRDGDRFRLTEAD